MEKNDVLGIGKDAGDEDVVDVVITNNTTNPLLVAFEKVGFGIWAAGEFKKKNHLSIYIKI
jgi:hypothetical protein